MKQPTMSLELITPQTAVQYLEKNRVNRKLKDAKVMRFARDISRDNWHISTDAIGFNGNGDLVNGQHRLTACIRAGKPFYCWVERGVPSEAIVSMDTGTSRSIADLLTYQGKHYATALASSARLDLLLERGMLRQARSVSLSNYEIIGWIDEHPKLEDAVRRCYNLGRKCGITVTIASPLYRRLHEYNWEMADEFFERLENGINLQEGHPILALRRWANRPTGRKRQYSQVMQTAVVIKTINAAANGEEMRMAVWKPLLGEEFPILLDGLTKPQKTGTSLKGVK